MADNFQCWIDIKFKKYYLDSSVRGLRLIFDKSIDSSIKAAIKVFVSYLRKLYFFPIRCSIHVINSKTYDGDSKGVFFYPNEGVKMLPSIYLCGKVGKGNVASLFFHLTRMLTFYFQWYFFLNKERTRRSLEWEATNEANYIVNEFLKQLNSDELHKYL